MDVNAITEIKPRTPGQQKLIKALNDDEKEVIGVFGPTGTGKSFLVITHALKSILSGKYRQFVLCRPLVDVVTKKELSTAELGEQFIEISKQYLYDILLGFTDIKIVDELIEKGKLIIADPHYLRGRTFDNSIVFLDDAQNIPPESAGELLMRIGTNSKFVVAGDPVFQRDLPIDPDGATLIREILLGEADAIVIDLGLKDIVRPGARRGARILLEMRMRKRTLSDREREVLSTIQAYAPDADILTVVDISDLKEKYEIGVDLPDVLAIAKKGSLGRLIGRRGEKISKIEEEANVRIRALELGLDLSVLFFSVHPLKNKIERGIIDIDLAGPSVIVKISERVAGPYFGPRGSHIRFVDEVFRRVLNIGIRTEVI